MYPITTLLTWTEVCGCIIRPPWADDALKDFFFLSSLSFSFFFFYFPLQYQFSSLCVINEPEYIHTLLLKTKNCHFISGNQAALNSAARKPRCYYISRGNLSTQKWQNFWTIITKYSLKMLMPFSCQCWGQYFGEWVPVRNCSTQKTDISEKLCFSPDLSNFNWSAS